MSLFNKISQLSVVILAVSGCSVTTIAPAEQLQKSTVEQPKAVAKSRDVVKKQPVSEYQCDNGKTVRVQKNSTKKNSPVTVTFNQTAYKLSPTVAKNGKKYSNIRWTWFEGFDGKATLSDNRHKVLAINCMKKAG